MFYNYFVANVYEIYKTKKPPRSQENVTAFAY